MLPLDLHVLSLPLAFILSQLPLDLHVLSLPLAFILSQDQTLLCISLYIFLVCLAVLTSLALLASCLSSLFNELAVEIVGVEPTTLCLQSRCSSQLSYTPEVVLSRLELLTPTLSV